MLPPLTERLVDTIAHSLWMLDQLPGNNPDRQPWWWGAPNDATYRASTIARVSAGLEPLPDFKTFVAYQRYTQSAEVA